MSSQDAREFLAGIDSSHVVGLDVTEDARKAITHGKVNPFFVMNGHDLMMILCEGVTLPAFLKRRIRILAEEGRMCVPYAEIA